MTEKKEMSCDGLREDCPHLSRTIKSEINQNITNWNSKRLPEIKDSFPLLVNMQKYEEELQLYLELYNEISNRELDYYCSIDKMKKIYSDIIDSFPYKDKQSKFDMFYGSLSGGKGSKFTAASLFFFELNKNYQRFRKNQLATLLKLDRKHLTQNIQSLFRFLYKIPGYEFTFELFNSNSFSQNEYEWILMYYISNYFGIFYQNQPIVYNSNSLRIIYSLYLKALRSPGQFQELYKRLTNKHPNMVGAVLSLIYIVYYLDFNINRTEYLRILNSRQKINLNLSEFIYSYHEFLELFFDLDYSLYRSKVKEYLYHFLEILKNWISKQISDKYTLVFLKETLNSQFFDEMMTLYDRALENDFQINEFSENQISYFFPQSMALSILFFSLKSKQELEGLASERKFYQYFGNEVNLINRGLSISTISSTTSNRFYDSIENIIGRYSGQIYTRRRFLDELKQRIKVNSNLDIVLLLKIYEISNPEITPQEFAQRLNIYSGEIKQLVRYILNQRRSLTLPQTFKNIENYIKNPQNILIKTDRLKALKWLNIIRETKNRIFIHQNIKYNFNWIEKRLQKIKGTKLFSNLSDYLEKIWKGNYPLEIFDSSDNLRASALKFIGTSKKPLLTETIENYFKHRFLFDVSGKYDLNKIVENVYKMVGYKPGHPIVLSEILNSQNDSVAIEIPVWKRIKNSNKYFIGHIDLLLVRNNTLIIGDYKNDNAEIFKSIPQITAYAIMLKERLNLSGIKLKCVIFSRNKTWEFDPEEVKKELIKFLEHERQITNRTQEVLGENKKSSLKEEIEMLILFIRKLDKD